MPTGFDRMNARCWADDRARDFVPQSRFVIHQLPLCSSIGMC